MKPLKNFIIVRPETTDVTTASGLIIESKPKVQLRGIAIDVGPHVTDVTQGDTVYFTEIAYVHKNNDEQLFVVSEDKVFAYA